MTGSSALSKFSSRVVRVLARIAGWVQRRVIERSPSWDRSLGCIDTLDGLSVGGWFIARYPSAKANRFELLLDGDSLGTFDASQVRTDLFPIHGTSDCGFAVKLSESLAPLQSTRAVRFGSTARLSLRSENGRVVARRRLLRRALPQALVEVSDGRTLGSLLGSATALGYIDRLDRFGCSGWALDPATEGRPAELALLVDGAELMRFHTSESRDDLSAKGHDGSRAGFVIKWPADLLHPGAEVDVRLARTGNSLGNSPRRLPEGPPIRSLLRPSARAPDDDPPPDVTVIVPIFNAYEAVEECLASLARHLASSVSVFLLDDCSTDDRVPALLRRYADQHGWRTDRNPENLGYTRTVNKAISCCAPRDVVLLNSDTVVTRRWLENLRYGAYAMPDVATVTALSDNAGPFSVPLPAQAIRVRSPDDIALTLTQAGTGRLLEVPTGHGFCLYIRRRAIDDVGSFDEDRFPRGYGEENDFCMRARRRGWKHLVSDKAFVFHKRSQSFGSAREALVQSAAEQLRVAYPEYPYLIRRFNDAEFGYVRHRMAAALSAEGTPRPTALYVISTQTGGTPQTNMDLMSALQDQYRCLLLACDGQILKLSELRDGGLHVIEEHVLRLAIEPIGHRSDEYDEVVAEWMYRHSVELLHVRHIAWHSLGLSNAAKRLGIPVVYSVHDYYSICPSLKLLDEKERHCAGRCTAGDGICQIELWPVSSIPPLKNRFVERWRQQFASFIEHCDRFVTTTASAADLFAGHFPQVKGRLSVIPHGRNFRRFGAASGVPAPSERLRVLVPGNISIAKGARLIHAVSELDVAKSIEFHFLGNIWVGLRGVGIHHGAFDRQDIQAKVDAIRPHLGAVFSIWPETYCHTLTEMWACGVPVVGLDIGAVGDRIRASGGGWLFDLDATPFAVLEGLRRIGAEAGAFSERIDAVRKWQAGEGASQDTMNMASAYREVYESIDGSRNDRGSPAVRTA